MLSFVLLEAFSLVFGELMIGSGFFHLQISFVGICLPAIVKINGYFVLVSDQATRVNVQGLLDGFNGLGNLFCVCKQIVAFEFPGMMFPRSVRNGLAVKVQALVLFSVVAGYSTLDMIDVGPKEVFGQKTTVGNDQDSNGAENQVESRSRAESVLCGGAVFTEQKPQQKSEASPTDHKGAGGTGGEFEKASQEKPGTSKPDRF